MRKLLSVLIVFILCASAIGQTFQSESFDGATFPPTGWVVTNAGTGNSWTRSTATPYAGAGNLYYAYSSTAAANTWAFAPGVSLTAGVTYSVDFYQNTAGGTTFPEKLKVTVGQGQTVAAQTTTIWDNAGGTSLTNTVYTLRTATFTPSVTGTYNFAFNCYSDANMWNLFVDEYKVYIPVTPNPPITFTATAVSSGGMTINWTDNSVNEDGFKVYRSADNVTFTQVGSNIATTTMATTGTVYSQVQTGLVPNTTYYYRISAYSYYESTFLTGTQATNAPSNIVSNASGNWSDPNTWVGGTVPSAGDYVTIASGHTVNIDAATNTCYNLTINSGGILTVATGTTFKLTVNGDLINNGTLDLYVSSTVYCDLTFMGAYNSTFSGTGSTTDLSTLTVNKGSGTITTSSPVLEVMPSVLTIKGVASSTVAAGGFLTTTTFNGIVKFSGAFTLTNPIFTAAAYSVPSTAGLWLNNSTFTVAGLNGSPTMSGLLRVTNGTYNIGTSTGNAMGGATTSKFIFEGGTVNISGRLYTSSACSLTVSGGTINVTTVGNSSSSSPGFGFTSSSNIITMSGGTINLVNRNTGTTKYDYYVLGATVNITGGTLNVGTAATATNYDFYLYGYMPNVVVTNTTNNKTAMAASTCYIFGDLTLNTGTTFNCQANTVSIWGNPTNIGNVINNGTITNTSGTGSNRFQFSGTYGAQTYSGTGVFGTTTTMFAGINVVNSVIFDPAVTVGKIVVNRVNLFSGTVTNSAKITLGNAGTSAPIIQVGGTATAVAGAFDANPTFNVGSGGLTVNYATAVSAVTSGFEIPASRLIGNLVIGNANGVTIAGGDLTVGTTSVAGLLTLTSGILTMGTNVLYLPYTGTSISGGSATSFVNGKMVRTFAASRTATGTYTAATQFPVGKGTTYLPFWIDPTTTAGGSVSVSGAAFTSNPGTPATGIGSLSPDRWEAFITSGSGNFTSGFAQFGDAGIIGLDVIVQATAANGVYGSIIPTSIYTAGTPNTLTTTGSQILSAAYSGYFSYGISLTSPPVVTTTTATSITGISAVSGGNVTDQGGDVVTARGVCYGLTALPTIAGTHTTDGTGTGVFVSNLTGLAAQTTYHYRAYATNSFGTSYGADLTFTTPCASITILPWSEGFEGLTTVGSKILPNCWSYENVAGTSGPTSYSGTYTYYGPHNGNNLIYTNYANTTWVFTPSFSLTAGTSYDFSFYMMNKVVTSPVDFLMDVAYGTSNSSAGMTHVLATGVVCSNSAYVKFTYTVVPTTSGDYYFGVKTTSATSTPWYISLDDFAMDFTPNCSAPTALNVPSVTENSAFLDWTENNIPAATEWDIEWGLQGFAFGSGTRVTATSMKPFKLLGLNASTTYQYYVRSVCPAGGHSAWSGPQAFTTAGIPACATAVSPTNGATNVLVTSALTWASGGGAPSGYHLYFGKSTPAIYIGDFTTLTYTPATQMEYSTTYYWKVVPFNTAGDAIGCSEWSFTTAAPAYCTASATCDEYISNVTVGTINNSSACTTGGYANYTAISTNMSSGTSYTVTVTNGLPYTGDQCGIWIDWNHDYDFSDPGEAITVTGGTTTFTATIVPPDGATIGSTRMRVRITYTGTISPCGSSSYGETEDYTVNIVPPPNNDVGTVSVDGIYAANFAGTTITPKATVKNYGLLAQTFNVTITSTGYTSTVNSVYLAPGASTQVTFAGWTPTAGNYSLQVCTQLTGDENPGNDCKTVSTVIGQWSTANATMSDYPYMGAGASYTDNTVSPPVGYLFSIGGNTVSTLGTECYKYNMSTDTWTTIAPLPVKRLVSCAVVQGTNLYVVGGSDGTTYQTSVYKYDILANTWTTVASLPVTIGWGKAVAYGTNYLYFAGGYDGTNYLSTVYLYDVALDTWTAATSMPAGVFGGAFAITGNTLVYTGGAVSAGIVNTVYVGAISPTAPLSINWATKSPFPGTSALVTAVTNDPASPFISDPFVKVPVSGNKTGYAGGTMFRFDGATWGTDGVIVATGSPSATWAPAVPNPCYVYKPATDTWSQKENVPIPVCGAQLGSVDLLGANNIHTWKLAIAGGLTSGSAVVNATQIFVQSFTPCAVPDGLTATNVTNSAADINWTENGTSTVWDIEYGPSGFAHGSGTMVTGTSTKPYHLSGLSGNTSYDVYVRANCGGGDLSTWSGVKQFTTLCNPQTTLPLTENFDGVTSPALPSCWFRYSSAANQPWVTATSSSGPTPYSSPNFAGVFYNSSLPKDEWLVSPAMQLVSGTAYNVKFWIQAPGWLGTPEKLKLVVTTDPSLAGCIGGITLWDRSDLTVSAWEQFIVPFTPTAGNAYYFAWHAYSDADVDYIVMDNVSIELAPPSCAAPTAVTATTVTATSVTISWTAATPVPGNGYEYEIRTSGAAGSGPAGLFQAGTVSTIGAYATGLTPQTTYHVYVRSNCGDNIYSDWTSDYSFTTLIELGVSGTVTNATCYGMCDGSIVTTVSGGLPPYTYLWSNGATTSSLTGLCAGLYNLTVTDANQSTVTGNWTVAEPGQISIIGTSTDVTCYGGNDGTFMITGVSGGTPPYAYLWSNGATTQNLSGLTAGIYSVTVSDSHLCAAFLLRAVNQPEAITVNGNITNASCPNALDGAVNISVAGGVPAYIYIWSNGATTENLSGLAAGDYTVTVTDSHNCTKTATFTVGLANSICSNITVFGTVTSQNCYNALNTITVAGTPFTFTVVSGGSASFIAGSKISYLPGTKVFSGGKMTGKIAPSGPWCSQSKITEVPAGSEEPVLATERASFSLFPNPTNGNFTIVQKGNVSFGSVKVEIYSMSGAKVLTENMIGQKQHEFRFADMPNGLYFVKVVAGDYVETIKLVKTR